MITNNSTESVNFIEEQVTSNLKNIVKLKQEISFQKDNYEDKIKCLLLELISILDSFDVKYENYEEKKNRNELSEESQKIIENFKSIYRKISRTLENYGVKEINFESNKAQIGLCKIIETKPEPNHENETILIILKKGFYLNNKVLRPAEVITVKN
jgi:molecular chaperone GrpE